MNKNENILEELLTSSKKIFQNDATLIEEKARVLYTDYCKKEENKSEKITMHTVKKIYPCVAFYKAVSECTNQKEKAYSIINDYFTNQCTITAKKLQKICSIPFIYKIVPSVMRNIIHSAFGEESGFKMKDYVAKKDECHIDMLICPYHSICKENGVPELTTVFCNADDISYGNMNPKLSWERQKTLGRGDELCDFILKIK